MSFGTARVAALSLLLGAHSAAATEPELRFEPPAPGTYRLPVIDRVDDHALLGSDGERTRLFAGLEPGRVVLVALIYRSCAEAAGCPLALATLRSVDAALASEPALRPRVQLVTLSFDPIYDSPEQMSQLARMMEPRGPWRFLTARSTAELAPVLDDFGQDVTAVFGPNGEPTRTLRHVLKIFLVDAQRAVRNIYSPGLLHPRLIENDIRTLLGEAAPPPSAEPKTP